MRHSARSYSPAERARIMAAVRRGLEVGRRVGVTARECGITEALYYRWVREQARDACQAGAPIIAVPIDDVDVQDKAALLSDTGRGRGVARRGPLPADLRERLQSRAVTLREEKGLPVELIAERLGVSQATVVRWLAGRSQGTGFVKVEVVADVPEPPPTPMPVLHSPGGYRVEGLDVAGLAELLRRLA